MPFNLVIIVFLVIGIFSVAIASIVILVRYADKHPNGKIEISFKILGCTFGAKASVGNDNEQVESPNVTSSLPKHSVKQSCKADF